MALVNRMMMLGNTKSAKEGTQKAQTYQWFSLCFLCWFSAFCVPHAYALQASTRNLPGQNPARKTKEPIRWRPRIDSRVEFDSLARIYYQGRFYALPHLMFVIDRAAKEGAGDRV